ncbi:uncharacterized protein N7483_001010 [Penicillium malachiteum]|uniref:uncharacterized protein n=1 Tax=Penicillium malachiteum TaxID=1324776 RepID=UPI002549A76F|nr:uncharacterized protein N7483_001010 [Penicillium malachiteum]KAJ5735885.1 hypothetical protein N7483_001010 [Penicillium malachiteum]
MYRKVPANSTWLEIESLSSGLEYWSGLENVLFVDILCVIATASLPLRLYTYLCLTQKKGGWALIWTTVAWTVGIPTILIMNLGAYYPELNWNTTYHTAGYFLLQLSASFARLGILAYIVDVQAQIYTAWEYGIGSVVLGNIIWSPDFQLALKDAE